MYTQCPSCLTVFSLDVATLVQAHGHVNCGGCGASFDSLATLTERCPPEPFLELPPNQQALTPPVVEQAVYLPPLPEPPAVEEPAPTPEPPSMAEPVRPPEPPIAAASLPSTEPPAISEQALASDSSIAAEHSATPGAPAIAEPTPIPTGVEGEDFSRLVFAPRFTRRGRRPDTRAAKRKIAPQPPRRPTRWPWVAVCTALVLALLLQLAWADRHALISSPRIGGWLESTCRALGCRLPLVRDTHRLVLAARTVRAHPTAPGALLVSATVHNSASFAQPYPMVTLTLADAAGQRVAMRRLAPRDYLDDDLSKSTGLAAGADLTVVIEVADPGRRAARFDFRFE